MIWKNSHDITYSENTYLACAMYQALLQGLSCGLHYGGGTDIKKYQMSGR